MKKIAVMLVFLLILPVYLAAKDDINKELKKLERRIELIEKQNMSLQVEIYLNRLRIKQSDILTNRNICIIKGEFNTADTLGRAYKEVGKIKKKVMKYRKKLIRTKNIRDAMKIFNNAALEYNKHFDYSVEKGYYIIPKKVIKELEERQKIYEKEKEEKK